MTEARQLETRAVLREGGSSEAEFAGAWPGRPCVYKQMECEQVLNLVVNQNQQLFLDSALASSSKRTVCFCGQG